MDSKSVLLEYALATTRNAALLEQIGERELAMEAWRKVLEIGPDQYEKDIASEALEGLGLTIPGLNMEARAQEALIRLAGTAPRPL
jgi:hypothetical protein